ncbi:MAG: methylated-DNA--[protein]-cysteine S-methyltransferase [Bacillota bacterium]|nr:methylated-DNA--[protein]-cysteine S-methyltransferase [Bacillota bacterium]MDP4169866.1 methylated-DNA--[protein]-cysteine S-methyltransferase [Bacillota bacterium]
MTERYVDYVDTPIGYLEIVCTETAVVSAMFVEGRTEAVTSHSFMESIKQQFVEYFNGSRKVFDAALFFNGTDFQRRVWDELTKIPYGHTISYKELAVKVGNEQASRAVGHANGKNIISIIVPCHRVIGSNNSLTGYAGGLERKQWLLEHER